MPRENDGVRRTRGEKPQRVRLREIMFVRLVGGAEAFADVMRKRRSERRPDEPEETARQAVPHDEPQQRIAVVLFVDAVAVKPQQIAVPIRALSGVRERVPVRLRDEEFVVALQEDDLPFRLFPAAPVEEAAVFVVFIAAQRDPQIEDVSEKDDPDVSGQARDGVKHAEEIVFRLAAGQMRVGDHQPALGHKNGSSFP